MNFFSLIISSLRPSTTFLTSFIFFSYSFKSLIKYMVFSFTFAFTPEAIKKATIKDKNAII